MVFNWELLSCMKAEPHPLVKHLLHFNSSTKIFHCYRKTCLYCITRFCPPFWNRCVYFLCWICVSASCYGHKKYKKTQLPGMKSGMTGSFLIKYWTKRSIYFFLKNLYIIKTIWNTFSLHFILSQISTDIS